VSTAAPFIHLQFCSHSTDAVVMTAFTALAFILCLRVLSKRPKSNSRCIFVTHICLQFGFISAYMALNTMGKIEAFTTHRDFPGGPVGWLSNGNNGVLCITGNVCIVFSIWLADGFLVRLAVFGVMGRNWRVSHSCTGR
jgi:hypothetical protein